MNKGRLDNLTQERRIIIIAGSNGAGKTTFAREFRRAAKQARKIALQTNTPLVIYENGRVVKKKLGKEKGR